MDRISKEAQHALRRTMEKYMSICRIILVCESITRISEPIKSRCLLVRIPSPSIEEICQLLFSIATRENIILSETLVRDIVERSNRNVRKAILMLEAMRGVNLFDWQIVVDDIVRIMMTKDQAPQKQLLMVRTRIIELLTKDIPSEVIIKTLTRRINSAETAKWAAFYVGK